MLMRKVQGGKREELDIQLEGGRRKKIEQGQNFTMAMVYRISQSKNITNHQG